MNKSLKSLFAIAMMLAITAVAARAQSAFTNALMGLNPAAYWPLQETVQPPAAYVETNLGSLGPIANAYYASTNAQILWTATPAGLNLFPSGDNNVGVDFKGSTAGFMMVPNTDHRISLPAGQPFSVEMWIDPTTFSAYEAPLSQAGPNYTSAGNPGLNGSTNGNSGWVFGQMYLPMVGQPAGGANQLYGWSFHVYNGNGTGGAEGDAVVVFNTNTWYHLVGVFDGHNATLYVNGTNQTSFQVPMTGSFSPDTWDPLEFGGSKGLGGANPYNGCMAEVAIYTNALSALTISNDYVAGFSSSGYTNVILANKPYMFWRMSAPPYTVPATNTYPTAQNYGSISDPNINGLYQPGTRPGYTGPQYAGLGAFTNACAFNGLNSAVMIWTNNNTLSSPLNVTNTSFSLAFWFKGNPADVNATVNPTLRGTNAIVSRGNSGWYVNIGANSTVPFDSGSGNDGYLHWNSGAGSDLVSSWQYNDGNWHFVVAEYTNTGTVGPGGAGWTATNLLYVDGYLDNSALMTNNAIGGVTNLALFIGGNPSTTVTNLGISPGYNTLQQYLAGSVAHVAYFTGALSGSQILNLYTNAASNQAAYIVGLTGGGGVTGGTGAYTVFSVLAHGSPMLGYQWYFNTSSNYSGATALANDNVNYFTEQAPSMTVSNLANSESGYYYVVVNNAYGYATSALTSLTVYATPVITAQAPAGAFSLYPNQTATLSVTVSAATNAALTYQWYTNGLADTTAGTGASYAAVATSTANSETFKCIVANTYGSATSVVDTATLLAFPSNIANSAFSTNLMGLNPAAYWPMHEKETQPFLGDVETNYGSLGALGNGYYQDWAGPYHVIHNAAGAIAGDSDGAAWFVSLQDTDLVIPHVSALSTIQGSFTLEAWVKPTLNGAQVGQYMIIIGQGGGTGLNNTGGNAGFALQYSGTPNTFSLVLWTNYAVNANYEQKTVAAFPPGAWYHIVATYDGISTVTYYVNGQVASYLFGNPGSGFPSKMVPDYWSPLTIGAGRWSATGTAPQGFNGEIDEVAVYTNMLTSQQIQNDYLAGTTVSSNYFQTVKGNNPLLYYRMDSPAYVDNTPYSSLPVLTNYGSVALNGVYDPSAFPGFDAGPNVGGTFAANMSGTNAMAGNGVSSFADAGISPLWNPVTTNSFSYTAWFRGYPCDTRNYKHIMAGNDSTWRVTIAAGGYVDGHGNADVNALGTVNDSNWHEFVVTAQPGVTNGVWTGNFTNSVYVDGVLITNTINTGTNNPAGAPGPEVLLGDEWGKTNSETELNGGRSFAGDMCEAAFFNYTLTPGQVQSLYNSAGIKPIITQNPVSLTGIVSLGFTNKVIASGSQPLFYQWYTNGVAIGGSAANTTGQITNNTTVDILTINPFAVYNAGTYTVVITNAYGSVTSAPVVITALGAPVITNALPVPYTNQFTLYAGVSPTFSVQAVGAPTLFYYWYSNNVAITGQTNASYTLTNVQTLFTNIYCVASNFLGTATSTVWAASVVADPTNSTGLAPYPQSVIALNPIAYWRLNEPDDQNSDGNPGLICHDYAGGNDGFYTNAALSDTSYSPTYDPSDSSAEFDYYGSGNNSDVNSIIGPDFATPNGVNAEFTVEAWINPFQAETTTAGIVAKGLFNEEEFTLDCGQTGEDLRFEVRNAAGTVYNANSAFSVGSAATSGTFNQWYHLVGVCDEANGAVSFYVNGQLAGGVTIPVASGITNSDAVPICIGSRSSSLPPYTFGDEDQQFYGFINDVAIFRYALSASQVASEYASAGNVAPFLSPAPATNVSASEFTTLTIPVTAYGSAPLSATWTGPNGFTYTTNGSATATALNATLIVSNVLGSWNNNTLQLAVHNSIGTTNVTVALTIFTNAPTLTVNLPAQVKLAPGEPYTYSALAVGAAPLYYQWYTNGVTPLGIANQTNATFTITGGSGGSTAYYSIIVSNLIGSATSIVSTVTVVAPSTSAYSTNVLNLHPVAYWPMHEVEAAAHGDIETNYGSLGVLGTGYYLDWGSLQGVNHGFPGPIAADANSGVFFPWQGGANNGGFTNCLQIPHASSGATFQPPFSVEIWFWQTNGNAGDLWSEADFVGLNAGSISSGNGADDGIRIYQQNGSPTVYCYYQSSTLNGGTYAGAGSPNGAWQDVVMTVDINTNATLYVNGASEGSNPLVDQYSPDYWDPITIATGKGYTRNTEGGFADFAVYPTNLSAADVVQHYNDGVSGGAGAYDTDVANDHPLIYLRMDSPAYSFVVPNLWPVMLNYGSAPAEGLYTPGTMPGAIAVATNGTPFVGLSGTNVALLSGVSSFADAGFVNAYNVTGSNALSIAAMFRGYPCDGRAQVIVGHTPSSWGLSVNTSGNLVLTLGANAASITSAGVYNDGNWHQVVGVYQPSPVPTGAGTAFIYVDGVLDTSVSTISSSGIEPGSTMDVMIGSDPVYTNNPTGLGANLAGEVCEVALYTNALTSTQVQSLYNSAEGFVSVVGFTNGPPIKVSVANNQLMLNWPSQYVGYYYLQVQTNSVRTGISNNWVPYGGSVGATLNSAGITNGVNPGNGVVFYRLMTNAP